MTSNDATGLVTLLAAVVATAACADSPVAPAAIEHPVYTQVTAGRQHVCALDENGAAHCWGANEFGQLGTGGVEPSATPAAVAGDLEFVRLTAGDRHTCGLTEDARAFCWGANRVGQLGTGGDSVAVWPTAVAGDHEFVSIDAGYRNTCGLTSDGRAYCWGRNSFGQNGAPATEECGTQQGGGVECNATPIAVEGGLSFAEIAVGLSHVCGLTTDGRAYCWGWNSLGQLGDGSRQTRGVPAPVEGGHTFSSISVGDVSGCGLKAAGLTWCWGTDYHGSLGLGTIGGAQLVPRAIAGDHTFTTMAHVASNSTAQHACATRNDGAVYCWGINDRGQLGTAAAMEVCQAMGRTDVPCSSTPLEARIERVFAQVTVALRYGCGLTAGDGEIWCWGTNEDGQRGTPMEGEPGALATRVPFPWEL